jgi:hypothetical protein
VAVNLNVEFAELGTDKILKLVDKDSKAVIAQFDATDFVVDGMLKSVTADQTNNTLTFEWNTDSGKTQTTVVELSKIADIYTGSNSADINVTVSNTNQISATLSTGVWNAINSKANTSTLGDLALKDKIVEGDINGTIAVGKISGLGALATKGTITHDLVTDFDTEVAKIKVTNAGNADTLGNHAADYFATKASVTEITKNNGTIDSKIAAYNTSKKFGDIITHNAAEFATSAQGTKADNALQEVTTTANGGLKVTNKNQIDIDTDIVFVLDCNW